MTPPPSVDADPFAPDATIFDARPLADAVMDPDGPDNVQILDPNDGEDLLGDRISVTCHAEPDGDSLLPITSVVIEVIDRAEEKVTVEAQPQAANEYVASDIFVGGLLNGSVTINCIATDGGDKQNSDSIQAFIDLGPAINILLPADGSFVHGEIPISFTITPRPIRSPDPDAAIASWSASIGGVDISSRLTVDGNNYSGSISTDDVTLFPVGVVGPVQLRVTAVNERGASRQRIVTFTIDDTPPLIEFIIPEAGALVGGIITVEVSVEDPAGIDETSVRAVFSNGPTEVADFELFPVGGGVFRGTYDSREIRTYVEELFPGTVLVFPTLTVTARDSVGNEGQVGEVVVMDYMPPLASLDPPDLREAAEDRLHGGIECTTEFDPLGDDATNDGQTVAQISEYRARIEDRANTALSTSDVIFYRAGVNNATAQLVFLDATNEVAGENGDALLVDTNGDDICDEVNPLLLAPVATPPNAILTVNMEGITPTGEQYKDAFEPWPYAGYPICDPPEETSIPPVRLCPSTGLQRVIEGPFGGPEQVIFTIAPTTDLSCVGFPIDLTTNGFTDGWFCVAVRVEDNLGNVGISQPMRVCLDHDGNGAEGCPGMPTYPSSADEQGWTCTDPLDPATCSNTDPQPVIPTQSPAIDCTGTYTPPVAGSGSLGTVDSTNDCLTPNADFQFPSFEVRREDLDE